MFSFLIGLSVYYSISKPINKLRNATTEIGNGKLNRKINVNSDDEIGQLATVFYFSYFIVILPFLNFLESVF